MFTSLKQRLFFYCMVAVATVTVCVVWVFNSPLAGALQLFAVLPLAFGLTVQQKASSSNAGRLARAKIAAKVLKTALPKGTTFTFKTVRCTLFNSKLNGAVQLCSVFAWANAVQVLVPSGSALIGVNNGLTKVDRNNTPCVVIPNGSGQVAALQALAALIGKRLQT